MDKISVRLILAGNGKRNNPYAKDIKIIADINIAIIGLYSFSNNLSMQHRNTSSSMNGPIKVTPIKPIGELSIISN